MVSEDQLLEGFQAERPRLERIAARILGDVHAAEDIVQQAWLRLHATDEPIENLAGWLTTVTSRLCLDRLRVRTPEPTESIEITATEADPADDVVLADTVGIALQVVLDRLTPAERVAFVLHDSFAVDFEVIASMLDTTAVAARKLASRARAKVRPAASEDALADWEIVDAFMAAAREGDFARLLELLAPDVLVSADGAASALGTPTHLRGADEVATFFNGAAAAAFPVLVDGRPGAAWIHRGEVKVAFDFTVEHGQVRQLRFRADGDVLAGVRRREGATERR
jgi:RNA polymerase sigma-70 factor (ECF subfamily)